MFYTKILILTLFIIGFIAGRLSVQNEINEVYVAKLANFHEPVSISPEQENKDRDLNNHSNKADVPGGKLNTSCRDKKMISQGDRLLNEECQQFLSLLEFINECNAQSGSKKKASLLYLASVSTSAVNYNDREAELYQKLERSFARVETARKRYQYDPSPENEVMLTCWLLLHGELLTLPPVHRTAGALLSLDEGEQYLKNIEAWDQKKIEQVKQAHPTALFLLSTVKARNHVFDSALKDSTKSLVAECETKTELLKKYRSLIQLMLRADTAYHLGDLEVAQKNFEEAADHARLIKKEVANFNPARKPFLFINEPAIKDRNPESLAFIDDTKSATIIPTIGSLAKLRFLQKDRSKPRENLKSLETIMENDLIPGEGVITDQNPLGYFVRGLVQEEQVTLLLRDVLSSTQKPNLNVIHEIEQTKKSAIEDLRKAQTLFSLLGPDEPALVSLNDDTILAALKAAQQASQNTFLHQAISESLNQLQNPESSHLEIYNNLSSAQYGSAWKKAEEYLFYHGTEIRSWHDYILTGIRTHQNSDLLKERYRRTKLLGLFSNEKWRSEMLAGRIELYSGREILGEERQFIESLLTGDRGANLQERKRLMQAGESFRAAVNHFDQSLLYLKEKQSIDRLILHALRAHAGALKLLVSQDKNPLRIAKYRRDAEVVRDGLKKLLVHSSNIDLQEAFAKAEQARGILLILDGEADQLNTALWSLATSNEVFGRLKFAGGATLEQGTLLLSAFLHKYSKPIPDDLKKESQMRRVSQMLLEGLVVGDLGNPDTGQIRIDQARRKLFSNKSSQLPVLSADQYPLEGIGDFLFKDSDHLSVNTSEKIIGLASILLSLEQSATPYSRMMGDILTPTRLEAKDSLHSALSLLKIDPSRDSLSEVYQALHTTRKPVESLFIALAAESKARALRLTEPEQRSRWISIAKTAVERSKQLQIESEASFNVKYPLLAQMRREMKTRLDSSEMFVQRAELAASRFGFDEAEERYRDGIIHHPRQQKLWSNLASLILTRLETNEYSKDLNQETTIRVNKSLNEILHAWNLHRPEDVWERELLQARYLVFQNKYAEALAALKTAYDAVPPDNMKAISVIKSKRAEVAALVLMKQFPKQVHGHEITQNNLEQQGVTQ